MTSQVEIAETKATGRRGLLEARGVSVSFGDRRVVDDVSVSLQPGQVTGIVGPNGSGKTTLLRALAGLTKPSGGQVTLDGAPLQDIRPAERARRIGYMPQSAGEHSFTAQEFVLMGRYPHMGRFRLEGRSDIEVARTMMERTGTLDFAHRRLQTLSGGERQRISLARLLTQDAEIMLLDEPTASLDMQHQLLTMETASEEAAKGAAVAVVLHDLSLAARFCDRLYLLHGAKLFAEGTPWEVVTQSNLKEVFSVEAAVEPEPISGRPAVSLLRIADDSADMTQPTSMKVHLICGAGSGRDLMHRLVLAGHTVTACVLGEGDADRETALRLGVEHVSAPPFSVISLDQDTAHRRLVRDADVVVVCEMAVGPGNLRNLEAAAEAKRLLMIERSEGAEWDYTLGAATDVYNELRVRGEVVKRDDVPTSVQPAT